jgi:hypothetical protein
MPIGLDIDDGPKGEKRGYAEYDAPGPTPLPVLATQGDPITGQGEIGTQTFYEDATRQKVKGMRVLSYAINDAYSKTTVFLDMTITTYADTNRTTLVSIETSRYEMAEDGTLTFKSLDAHNYVPVEYEVLYKAK